MLYARHCRIVGGFLGFKMELQELYSDFILDLYRHPLNKGNLVKADAFYKDVNPFCGDVVEMGLQIQDGKIKEILFNGQGCAISQAAASVLTEMVKGKEVEVILQLPLDELLQEMHLRHLKESPARIKCAALSLKVLKTALYQYLGQNKELEWKEVVA